MIKRYGRVIDNLDEDQLGKVQVRIIPEMNSIEDDKLPWVMPRITGTPGLQEGVGKHSVPEIESIVTVFISEDWQTFEFTSEAPRVTDWYPYAKFEEDFDIADMEEAPEYPEPHFTRTPDGTIVFHNQTTGDIGIQHPTGLYVLADKDGNLFVKFINKVKISNIDEDISVIVDGEEELIEAKMKEVTLSLTSDSATVVAPTITFEGEELVATTPSVLLDGDTEVTGEMAVAGAGDNASLFTPLEKVLNALLSHIHIAPSGPTSPASGSDMVPLSAKLAVDVPQIKSKKVTLD